MSSSIREGKGQVLGERAFGTVGEEGYVPLGETLLEIAEPLKGILSCIRSATSRGAKTFFHEMSVA